MVVRVSAPEQRPPPLQGVLANLFGLTPTETNRQTDLIALLLTGSMTAYPEGR